MLRVVTAEKLAWFKMVVDIAAAITIVWYIYRIASGEFFML